MALLYTVLCILLLLQNVAPIDVTTEADIGITEDISLYQDRVRWANAAYHFIRQLNCNETYFTSHKECTHLLNLRKQDIVMYMAQSPDGEQFVSMLPDGGLRRAGAHDAVVALDPYPKANFGHFLMVFFIDRTNSPTACTRHKGTYLGNQECMTIGLKHRCKNSLERQRYRNTREITSRFLRKMARRCEINFLPLVHPASDKKPAVVDGISQGYEQHLLCQEDLPEFGTCPSLRPANETLRLICNPIRDNTRRCETSREAVGTRCRMFESCDQAVMISGGWSRQTSVLRHTNNIVNMYHMLRRNGFHQGAIKIFFANGLHGGIQEEEGSDSIDTEVFPAAMKTAMRFHIQKLCGTPHCVDSLVFYLNNPTRHDGSMLLWDVDNDGKTDPEEQYTVDEFLSDISSCKARSVQVIADQSYAGEITKAIRKSKAHGNVMAFASCKDNEYSYGSLFTDLWANYDHSHTCTQQVFQQVKSAMLFSQPDLGAQRGSSGTPSGSQTLFGAPCNVEPPFTKNELKLYYRGCQSVPTEVWLRTFFSSPEMTRKDGEESQPPESNSVNRNDYIETGVLNWSGDHGAQDHTIGNNIPLT